MHVTTDYRFIGIQNDSITGVKQLITGISPTRIEGGSFNREDNSEDVAIKDGVYIRIFKNLSDGFLQTNAYSFPIYSENFKLRQINEKTEGYPVNNTMTELI